MACLTGPGATIDNNHKLWLPYIQKDRKKLIPPGRIEQHGTLCVSNMVCFLPAGIHP